MQVILSVIGNAGVLVFYFIAGFSDRHKVRGFFFICFK